MTLAISSRTYSDRETFRKALVGQQITMNALQELNKEFKEQNDQLIVQNSILRKENLEMRDLLKRHGPELINSICKHLLQEIHNTQEFDALVSHLPTQEKEIVLHAFSQLEEPKSKHVVVRESEIDFVFIQQDRGRLEQLLKDLQTLYKYMDNENGYDEFLNELKNNFPEEIQEPKQSTGKRLITVVKKGARVSLAVMKYIYKKAFLIAQMISTGTTLAPWALIAMTLIAKAL